MPAAMIKLVQFGPGFGMRTMSPFGLKLEAYMRMAGIPYEVTVEGNPSGAPKGKIPYIVDGDLRLGDSQFIIEHLVRAHGDKVDGHLTQEQRAIGHALRRMVEEGLYFSVIYSRWMDDNAFARFGPVVFAGMPGPVRAMVGVIARRALRKTTNAQGVGRHTAAEVNALACADLTALSVTLGPKPFFHGEKPSSTDASVYGAIAGIYAVDIENEMRRHAQSLGNLKAFCSRMETRLFSD